jgi:intein-encoded DNA endonuclease-like protein
LNKYDNKTFLEHQIIELHKTHEELSHEINCNINTLKYWLKKYNIKSLKNWEYLNNYYKDNIINRYINNETLSQIANFYNVNYQVIEKVLKINNIPIRNIKERKYIRDRKFQNEISEKNINGRKFSLNHNFFKKWNSDMAYILGFIYADGCIKETQLIIELNNVDLDLLTIIKDKLEYTGELKSRDKTNSTRLAIRSCILTDDLKKLGVIENKTKCIRMPNIPIEFFKDFIRGYFDGDGSVGIHMKNQIRVRFSCGNKLFLEDLLYTLKKNFNIPKVSISKDTRSKSNYSICYSTNSSKMFFHHIYKDINCMKCNRKYNNFINALYNNK